MLKNKMKPKKIYLDAAATTPVAKEVLDAMMPYFSERFGNASSLHAFGRNAREAIEKAREKVAGVINAKPKEIVFTSGGTEADNLAIKGLALAHPNKRHIITSAIEHPAVLETCRTLEKQGYNLSYIPVDSEGIIDLDRLEQEIRDETLLVSIMHVNNEIGTIQPIKEIAKICREHDVYFHTDAVQSFGKLKLDMKKIKVDLLSISAHKLFGPKGVGALYVRNGVKLKALMNGGDHEQGLRSGTENTAGIVGLGKASEIAVKKISSNEYKSIEKARNKLLERLLEIQGVRLNGSKEKRIFNNINVSFHGIEGEAFVLMLDKKGIACSTGSACSSHKLEPSHVLLALGLSELEAHGSLRLTLAYPLTEDEIEYVASAIEESVRKLRRISPFK